jgi:hypothetical protein
MRAIVLGVLAVLVLGIAAAAVYFGSAAPLEDAPEDVDEPAVARAQPVASSTPSERSSPLAPARESPDARLTELERTLDALRERLDALESRRAAASPPQAPHASLDDDFVEGHRAAIAELVESVLVERDFEREAQRVRARLFAMSRTRCRASRRRRGAAARTIECFTRGHWQSRFALCMDRIDSNSMFPRAEAELNRIMH